MWKRPLRCHKNLRTIQQLTNFGDAAVEESPPLLEKERDGPLAVVVSERTTTSRFNSIKSSRFDVKIGIKRPHSEEEEHDSCGVTSSEAHTRNTQTNENSNHSERTFVLLSSNEAGTESSTATDKSAAAVSQHDVQIPDFPVTCHGSEIGRPVVLTVTSSKSDDVNFFYDAPSPCTPLRDQTQGELRWCEKANEVTSLKPKWELSEDQKRICDIVVNQHRSVLLTGGAGTGKSHLLRAIIEALPKAKTFVTATTGLAALNLSGTTLHSFSGCGLVDQHKDTAQSVYKSISNKKKAKANWRKCSVLIVDEVSMLEAWFFEFWNMLRGVFVGTPCLSVVFSWCYLVTSCSYLP
uniref:ATP-dependent DNA helicase n=1 Tax=Trypanosoma congolense (strain IL3000) TaxID=1068625 RepID=G0UR11_TRYCI|nr:unnamed protein product [Trypanosoma congolense IL3000]